MGPFASLTLVRLQALQARHNVSGREFGRRCGVTGKTGCEWLSGRRLPSAEWLDKILRAFDETPETFEDLSEVDTL